MHQFLTQLVFFFYLSLKNLENWNIYNPIQQNEMNSF